METQNNHFLILTFNDLLVLIICCSTIVIRANAQKMEKKLPKQKVMVLGHAHMDPAYRWRCNEIENREIYKTFSDVLKMLERYPDLTFAQSYLLYYSSIQQQFPELFDEVKESIAEGQWSVVGGQWVETDET